MGFIKKTILDYTYTHGMRLGIPLSHAMSNLYASIFYKNEKGSPQRLKK